MKFEAIIHHTEAVTIIFKAGSKKEAYREISRKLKWGDFEIDNIEEISGWELVDLEEK